MPVDTIKQQTGQNASVRSKLIAIVALRYFTLPALGCITLREGISGGSGPRCN